MVVKVNIYLIIADCDRAFSEERSDERVHLRRGPWRTSFNGEYTCKWLENLLVGRDIEIVVEEVYLEEDKKDGMRECGAFRRGICSR
jgi:hypothetical protein